MTHWYFNIFFFYGLPAIIFSTPAGAMPVCAVLKFCKSTMNALSPLDNIPNTPGSP